MTAFVLAQALLEKCGGDSLGEVRRNLHAYVAHVAGRIAAPPADAAVAADGTPLGAPLGGPGSGPAGGDAAGP
jgi:hypothetical protein